MNILEDSMEIIKNRKYLYIAVVATILILIPFVMLLIDYSREFEEKSTKIGFIILGDVNEPGWNKSHYEGIKAACEKYGIELLVRDKVRENSGQCTETIKELAENGAGMIFLASYSSTVEAQNLVKEYPNIAFATNSAEVHAKNMTAYFVRVYQARYLSGILAGMKTKTNVVGYVAAMSNSEVNRQINAFTLGVHRINPQAKVLVMFTNAWQNEEVEAKNAEKLIENYNADVLTYHQDEATVCKVAEANGVNFIAYNEVLHGYTNKYLASIVCHWDLYYMDILQRYLKGEINYVKNHWIGIDRGAITIENYSSEVNDDIRDKIEEIELELMNNKQIFSGEIYDNQGNKRCGANEAISDDLLLEDINWLVQGVEVVD